MNKKIIVLTLAVALLCSLGQFVFADAVDPGLIERTGGGTIAVVLIIAVLLVAVVLIVRRIRRKR